MSTALDLLNIGTGFIESVSRARDKGMARAQKEIQIMLAGQQQAQAEFAQEVELLKLANELQTMEIRRAIERQRLRNEQIRTRNLLMQGLQQGGTEQRLQQQAQDDAVLTNITAEGVLQSLAAKEQINLTLAGLDAEEKRIREAMISEDGEITSEEEREQKLAAIQQQRQSVNQSNALLEASLIAGGVGMADRIINGYNALETKNIPAAQKKELLTTYQNDLAVLQNAARLSPEFRQAVNLRMINETMPELFRIKNEQNTKIRKVLLQIAASSPNLFTPEKVAELYKQLEEMRKSNSLPDVDNAEIDKIVDRFLNTRGFISQTLNSVQNSLFNAPDQATRQQVSQQYRVIKDFGANISSLTDNISDLRSPQQLTPASTQVTNELRPVKVEERPTIVSSVGGFVQGATNLISAPFREAFNIGAASYNINQKVILNEREYQQKIEAAYKQFQDGEITFDEYTKFEKEQRQALEKNIAQDSMILRGAFGVKYSLLQAIASQFQKQPLVVDLNKMGAIQTPEGVKIGAETIFEARVLRSPYSKYLTQARKGNEVVVSDAAVLLARDSNGRLTYQQALDVLTNELEQLLKQ